MPYYNEHFRKDTDGISLIVRLEGNGDFRVKPGQLRLGGRPGVIDKLPAHGKVPDCLSGGTGLNGSIGGGAVEPFGVRWSFHVGLVVVIFPKNAAGSGYFL